MAITTQTLVATVYEALRARGVKDEPSIIPRLIPLIPVALSKVVSQIIASGDMELIETLRRDFTAVTVDGEADLTPLLLATQGLAPDALGLAEVYHAASPYQATWHPDRTAVAVMAGIGFLNVAREGTKLILSDPATGTTGTLDGTVTIRGVGVPVTTAGSIDIPLRLEGLLVETLAEMVSPRPREKAA